MNIPQIPRLKRGSFINPPTLKDFLFHNSNSEEIVRPLRRNNNMKYEKKSEIVDAEQLSNSNIEYIEKLIGDRLISIMTSVAYTIKDKIRSHFVIEIWELSPMEANEEDYIIKDGSGNFSICIKDQFEQEYSLLKPKTTFNLVTNQHERIYEKVHGSKTSWIDNVVENAILNSREEIIQIIEKAVKDATRA